MWQHDFHVSHTSRAAHPRRRLPYPVRATSRCQTTASQHPTSPLVHNRQHAPTPTTLGVIRTERNTLGSLSSKLDSQFATPDSCKPFPTHTHTPMPIQGSPREPHAQTLLSAPTPHPASRAKSSSQSLCASAEPSATDHRTLPASPFSRCGPTL